MKKSSSKKFWLTLAFITLIWTGCTTLAESTECNMEQEPMMYTIKGGDVNDYWYNLSKRYCILQTDNPQIDWTKFNPNHVISGSAFFVRELKVQQK